MIEIFFMFFFSVSALFEDSSEDEMDSLFAKKSVIKPPVKPSLFEDSNSSEDGKHFLFFYYDKLMPNL